MSKRKIPKENLRDFLGCPISWKDKTKNNKCERCRLTPEEQIEVEEDIRKALEKEKDLLYMLRRAKRRE